MKKPKVLIVTGYGINCEQETAHAFKLAGAEPEIIHINDLINGKKSLNDFQILAFPGGFSFGDDTGAGNAFANRIKNNLWEDILNFVESDKLVIGICNGFQVLVNLGLLPGIEKNYGERKVALTHNKDARYLDRWVDLKINNNSPWLKEIRTISLPIAHGEGNFFASDKVMSILEKQKQISLKYIDGEMCEYQNLIANPNGSLKNVAGITNQSGRILGLMPHPERAIFFHHLPNWQLLKAKYRKKGQPLPKYGPGLKIFRNAVNYHEL